MFRITEDPSSGSLVQCLAKNYRNGSIVSVDMDMVGVSLFENSEFDAVQFSRYVYVPHEVWYRPKYTVSQHRKDHFYRKPSYSLTCLSVFGMEIQTEFPL